MVRTALLLVALAGLVMGLGTVEAGDGPSSWPRSIKVGVIPTEGGGASKERFEPLGNHLEEVLGIDVEIVSAADYAGVITAMEHKHIDFAYFGPKSYTEAHEKANALPLGMELDVNGNPGYTPIIIARKGSGIDSFEDARGKTFCFTDPNSTSGCLMPSVVFSRDLKIDPEAYFRDVSFSGSHGASILAVKNGKVDVAATNDLDLGRMIEKGDVREQDFVIIYSANPLPGAPMCGRADLPASLRAAFAGALMMLKEKPDVTAKLGNGGYAPVMDADYDIIRYLKKVKADKARQG
jgi:phosphonate transport system substrate-binding protein